MNGLHIENLRREDIEQASQLFCAGYASLRQAVPDLPPRYEQPGDVQPLLDSLASTGPLTGAYGPGRRLLGYLGGVRVPQLKGKDKGIYCPEWAHAVDGTVERRGSVYRRLYAKAAEAWVDEARLNQAVTLLVTDREALEAWFWNGFGLLVVDVVRDLAPVTPEARGGAVTVRTAVPADLPQLFPVFAEHEAYYNRSPIFLPKPPLDGPDELESVLADPKALVWLALDAEGRVLGLMQQAVDAKDACTIVRDPGTVACNGAYVLPAARRRGVGAILLAHLVDWAREHGYARISLDFEAANLYGSAFWLRHLTPVCYSVLRHVNDHILTQGRG